MKKIVAIVLALTMILGMSTVVTAAAPVYVDGTVDVAEYIGNLNVGKFNNIWSGVTTNIVTIITPGTSIDGLYYEKLYAKYNEEGGYYEVVEKVANHRSYTQVVQEGYIGLEFNYAPLTTAGSDIAKANWKVWQHIRVGDRLYLKNIDLELKNLETSGVWGSSTYKSNSYIEVESVNPVYPTVTPYSNRTIVAQGDSITVGGGWTSTWGDYFSTTVINSGFGGDTSWASLASRYDDHVAAYNPEIVIVSFGINDAFNAAPSTELMEKYKTALRGIYDRNTALGATTVFMNANVIKISAIQDGGVFDKGDYSAFGGEAAYLDAFEACMTEVAEEKNCVLIDIYSMWKAENLSPDNIIDSCHPNGHGYDMNWTVQKPALIENMKTICGDDIRVLEGTTAKHAIDGMPECNVVVKDADGNIVADDAVLLDGYTVSYSEVLAADSTDTPADYGTYTVKTFKPTKALISKDAPFSVRGDTLYYTDAVKVSEVKENILNLDVTVIGSGGTKPANIAELSEGDTVIVKNSADGETVASYTVADGNTVEDGGGDDSSQDPYEGMDLGENLLANKPYTSVYNAFQGLCSDAENKLLTDGAYRGDGANSWNGDVGVIGVTVEYAGTTAITSVEFKFDKPTDIHVITFKGVRICANRNFKVDSIGVSTDGENYTNVPYTVTETVIEGAPGNGTSNVPQYYDVAVRADVIGATGLKLSFGTGGAYIVQLDEIEAAAYVTDDDSSNPDIAEITYGDVNGDGKINSLDAAQVLKHDAMLITLSAEALVNADVNDDGKVNSIDAAQILKYDAFLIDEFPAQKTAN